MPAPLSPWVAPEAQVLGIRRQGDAQQRCTGRRSQGRRALDIDLVLLRDVDRGIVVDAWGRTSVPGIWAAGDVAGPYLFTHMASHQAWYAAVNALFGKVRKFRVDYSVVPWATFTDPEVARVCHSSIRRSSSFK